MTNSLVKLHSVRPPASEVGTTSEEPTWHEMEITEDNYQHELIRGLNWHNEMADDKDVVLYIKEWLAQYRPSDKKIINRISKKISGTVPALARMQLQGFNLNEEDGDKIWKYISSLVETKGGSHKKTTPTVKRPSVQDRMKAQVSAVLSDIDFAADEVLEGRESTVTLDRDEFKTPHFKIIQNHINGYISEWSEAYDNWKTPDNQLAEGYQWVGKKFLKAAIATFTDLESAISKKLATVKVIKIRKKKPTDKKKMVSKLKYKKEGSKVDPVEIIGSSGLWIFDEKKRKLCHFEAEVPNGIHVKGTTILGIKDSFSKTLRKPDEQIEEFKKLTGKRAPKNFFDGIKAKPQLMSGRTNSDMIILGVY